MIPIFDAPRSILPLRKTPATSDKAFPRPGTGNMMCVDVSLKYDYRCSHLHRCIEISINIVQPAANMAEKPNAIPKLLSIVSPAITMIKLSTKPNPTIGTAVKRNKLFS